MISLQRVRIRLSRLGLEAIKLSQLQQIEMLRKALLNSGWPLDKTEGKKPKIKASFGPAISVGYESEAEYCDVELISRLDLKTAPITLGQHLSTGYKVMTVKSIPRFFPSLDQTLNAASYEMIAPYLEGIREQWENFSKKDHVMVVKKKSDREEVIDARACVKSWTLDQDRLLLDIRFGPGRTLKPERILQAVCGFDDAQVEMGTPTSTLRVKRLKLYLEKNTGELVEP